METRSADLGFSVSLDWTTCWTKILVISNSSTLVWRHRNIIKLHCRFGIGFYLSFKKYFCRLYMSSMSQTRDNGCDPPLCTFWWSISCITLLSCNHRYQQHQTYHLSGIIVLLAACRNWTYYMIVYSPWRKRMYQMRQYERKLHFLLVMWSFVSIPHRGIEPMACQFGSCMRQIRVNQLSTVKQCNVIELGQRWLR